MLLYKKYLIITFMTKNSFKDLWIIIWVIILFINIIWFILNKSDITNYLCAFNIILSILFLIVYFLYFRDYEKIIKNIKNIKNSQEWYINICNTNPFFSENINIEKNIKKLILTNNLNQKNFSDFKETYSKFLSKEIYDELWEKGYERISLWNFKIKNICIMFLDIVWFTSISEWISPNRALFLLNVYFDWIWEIIMKNKWSIDKYLWDWIMVTFENSCVDNAINTSIEIQEFIEKFKIWEYWKKLKIWIWINFWEVILWTIWTKKRMEATFIWDTINTASRIQDLTRKYNSPIIISKDVYDNISNKEIYKIKYLWKENLKWKTKKLDIYSINLH